MSERDQDFEDAPRLHRRARPRPGSRRPTAGELFGLMDEPDPRFVIVTP